jgi:rare lipoprotein A
MKLLRKLIMITAACLAVPSAEASTNGSASADIEHGKASWYEIKCNGGTHTASGKKLNDWAMTAAHRTLPMGTKVRVTNKENGRSVVVTITDRGPYIKGRIIDVTKGVAHKLKFINSGVVPVKVEIL